MRLIVTLCLLLTTQFAFAAADYAREKKWADEITPGIVVGEPVYLEAKGRKFLAIETVAPNARAGVIVVHGIGIHPDWGMIGTLRQRLADQGYTTLSIQMPVLAVDAQAKAYLPTFPEAAARIDAAVQALQARGYRKIAIVSHSLGARMSQAYFKAHPDTPVNAWVAMGMPGNESLAVAKIPVYDLYGEKDLPAVLKHAKARADQIRGNPKSKQTKAPGADHFFTDQEDAMVKYVKDYLDATL